MGNGPHGMGPFSFLTNASQTVKTDFETIMKDNSLTENERTQDIDDLIKDENDTSLDAAYAAFKTKLAQREKDVTTKFNAKVANASLTSDQTSLLNSIVAIKNNGSLTRKEMKQ
uniref:DUF148 domain-containing protein n=1 Tax=Rhabditophanes sp. KR3021 TaxID=114890 RepID=A0AC35TPD2_9BILA